MEINRKNFAVLFSVIALLVSGSVVSAEQLVIPGSGANEVLLRELALAFMAENPEHQVIIPKGFESDEGIRLVGKGENVLARVARPIRMYELSYKLEYRAFAYDMVLFVVGEKAGVKELSSRELADIFSGKITNWKEVGGNDYPIKLLIRERENSSLEIILRHLDSFDDIVFSKKAKILFHDYEMIHALSKYTTAIGWLNNSSMKKVSSPVQKITVDGVEPKQENAYDGTYNLTAEYALVYIDSTLTELAESFLDFVFSKKGNQMMVESGMIPAKQFQQP